MATASNIWPNVFLFRRGSVIPDPANMTTVAPEQCNDADWVYYDGYCYYLR